MTALSGAVYMPPLSTITSIATSSISAANAYFASVIRAPKSGVIDRLMLCLNTVTTGGVIDMRVETVDTTGIPTGTLWSAFTNTGAGFSILSTDDFLQKEATLIAGATVSKGDLIALKALLPASSMPSLALATSRLGSELAGGPHRVITGTKSPVPALCIFPRYSDGDYPLIPGIEPAQLASSATTMTSGSSPDERGIKLTSCPFTFQAVGIWFICAAGGSRTVVVYDENDNVLDTATYATQMSWAIDEASYYPFSSKLTFKTGSTYRITIIANDGTGVTPYTLTWAADPVSARRFPWITGTVRTDLGAWTDQANSRVQMGLAVTDIDASHAGGRRSIGMPVGRSSVI